MRRNLTTKPAGNILTKIDWTHPLTRGLVAAWVFSEDSDYLHKAAATNEVRCTYPDIVYGVPLQLIGPSDSVAAASSYGGVPGSTGMGVRFATGINNANDRLASVTNPSPRLQVTKEVSFFWRGACYDVPHTINFEPIFIMNYEAASKTSPFSVYGVTRSNSTDLRFEHDAGGAFNSLAVTNFTTSVGKPQTVGMSRSADGAFTRVYTEGIRRTQDAVAGNMVYGTSPCIYVNGNSALGAGGGTNGTFVDVIYIWNRALSDFEQAWIAQHPYEILFSPYPRYLTLGPVTKSLPATMAARAATLGRKTSLTPAAAMAAKAGHLVAALIHKFTATASAKAGALVATKVPLHSFSVSITLRTATLQRNITRTLSATKATFAGSLSAIKAGVVKTLAATMAARAGTLTTQTRITLGARKAQFSGHLALAVQHGPVPPVCIPAACDTLPTIISHVEVCENPGS